MKFWHVDKKRLAFVVLAVIVMGFCLSLLNRTGFGTDPCTCMNLGISKTIGWTLGTWQAVFNCLLLIVVIVFAREQIGWGTVANMFLVGYSFDFFSWLMEKLIPADLLGCGGVCNRFYAWIDTRYRNGDHGTHAWSGHHLGEGTHYGKIPVSCIKIQRIACHSGKGRL